MSYAYNKYATSISRPHLTPLKIVLVGAFVSAPEAQAATTSLRIDDGTGLLDVRFWTRLNNGDSAPCVAQIEALK